MDKNKMIPPKIWETDCKYCRFRDSEENFEYGTGKNKYDAPCKIGIFNGRSLHWNDNTKSFDLTDQEVYTEHCGPCRPNEFYGICGMCEYFNGFHTESEYPNGIYCTHPKGPENRRNVMPHINAGYGREVTSFNYTYFTCDRYKVDHSWKETLKREALEGKIPKNFDPDTFEPLEYMEGVPVEAWEKSQQEYEDSKPENVKKKKLQELLKNKVKKMEVTDDSSN